MPGNSKRVRRFGLRSSPWGVWNENAISHCFKFFPIISVAHWITVFARFCPYLDLFESITKHWSTGAKLFCILKFLSAASIGVSVCNPQGPLILSTQGWGMKWLNNENDVNLQQGVFIKEFFKNPFARSVGATSL